MLLVKQMELEWDRRGMHNQPMNLDTDDVQFKDVVTWIRRSRIGFAVENVEPVYVSHIEDFWRSARVETVARVKRIKATVRNRPLFITEDTVRTVLRLRDEPGTIRFMAKADIHEQFRRFGYKGEFDKRGDVKKTQLTRDWRLISHVFIMSLGHRKGGYNALSTEWSTAMIKICKEEKFNLSGMIFDYLIKNAEAGSGKWAMYPRFIQMMINTQHENLPLGDEYIFTKGARFFTECNTPDWEPMLEHMYAAQRYPIVIEIYNKINKRKADAAQARQQPTAAPTPEPSAPTTSAQPTAEEIAQEKARGKRVASEPARAKPSMKKRPAGLL